MFGVLFKECELWCTYIGDQFLTLKYLILIFFEILQHPFVGGAEASNGEGLNRIFAERYNCRKRRRSPFTQNVPIFQFTIYTQLPIVLVFLKMPFRQISSENIVVKGRNPPPFPLKILTSNFGQTVNLYCLGQCTIIWKWMGWPVSTTVQSWGTFQQLNALNFCNSTKMLGYSSIHTMMQPV